MHGRTVWSPFDPHPYELLSQNWEGAMGSGISGVGRHPDNQIATKLKWLKCLKKNLRIDPRLPIWYATFPHYSSLSVFRRNSVLQNVRPQALVGLVFDSTAGSESWSAARCSQFTSILLPTVHAIPAACSRP